MAQQVFPIGYVQPEAAEVVPYTPQPLVQPQPHYVVPYNPPGQISPYSNLGIVLRHRLRHLEKRLIISVAGFEKDRQDPFRLHRTWSSRGDQSRCR